MKIGHVAMCLHSGLNNYGHKDQLTPYADMPDGITSVTELPEE